MSFAPLIRYSGGKRRQAEDIVKRFPHDIDTCYIPFLGSGSIVYQIVCSRIKCKHIVASDIYAPLMGIWNVLQSDPNKLFDSYCEHVNKANEVGQETYYNQLVNDFNIMCRQGHAGLQQSCDFFFIMRSCLRGQMEFDDDGNFITKFQAIEGAGIAKPQTVKPIIYRWSYAMQNVELRCESYDAYKPTGEHDYCFFDPPYFDGTWYHDHNMDWNKFWEYLRSLPCDYSITLNSDKKRYPIPEDLYTLHEYIYYGISTGDNGASGSRDSLWQKRTKLDMYEPSNADAMIETKSNPNARPQIIIPRAYINDPTRGAGGEYEQNTVYKMISDMSQDINLLDQKLDTILTMLGHGEKDDMR